MSNLVYLLLAIALSVVGTLILLYRQRKPSSMESTIEEFNRELRALSPERRDPGEGHPG
ncbi:MAG TPA: hypothetical protein VM030_07880 [Acidimicrobiales bacterium]|nr:hypothetical protein [Acidimicrobiales bacterium]